MKGGGSFYILSSIGMAKANPSTTGAHCFKDVICTSHRRQTPQTNDLLQNLMIHMDPHLIPFQIHHKINISNSN